MAEFVLAVDFGGTKIDIGTATTGGELIESERIQTKADAGAEQAVERTLEVGRALMERTDGHCVGAAAVSPGVIGDNGILLAPNVPGWDSLRLPTRLSDGLGVPVLATGNDVNAAALAETRWGALAGTDVGLFLSLGTGIKAGLVIGGHVFEGAHGAAGEIGYSLRHPADATGFASGNAPLEEFVGGRALGEKSAALQDPKFLADWLGELTMQVTNLAIAVDPERIAIGGGLTAARAEEILPALRDRIALAAPFAPQVVPARFMEDGALRGAAALAVDRLVMGAAP